MLVVLGGEVKLGGMREVGGFTLVALGPDLAQFGGVFGVTAGEASFLELQIAGAASHR